MARQRIGELLLERGIISHAQLDEGLKHQRLSHQRLGATLIQKGFLTEDQLVEALSVALGIPRVDLNSVQASWAAIHMLRARVCEIHGVLPIRLDADIGRKELLLAMTDPLNVAALEEIEFTTGFKVAVRLATRSDIQAAIRRYYYRAHQPPAEEDVIIGVEVPSSFQDGEAEEENRARDRHASGAVARAAKDLQVLFGIDSGESELESLERMFWALMRIMARKGLITRDEFLEELDRDPSHGVGAQAPHPYAPEGRRPGAPRFG